eukprot:1159883-Pelagomonas_calceolata.AAC.6
MGHGRAGMQEKIARAYFLRSPCFCTVARADGVRAPLKKPVCTILSRSRRQQNGDFRRVQGVGSGIRMAEA